jgi:hypothetical protein
MVDTMDRHTYAVGYAYPSSPVAVTLGRGLDGTWYVQCDDSHQVACGSATEAAAYVQARVDEGHRRSQYCQTLTAAWPIIVRNEQVLADAIAVYL